MRGNAVALRVAAGCVAFVVFAGLVDLLHPAVLTNVSADWLPWLLLLWSLLLGATAGAYLLAAATLRRLAGAPLVLSPLPALPLGRVGLPLLLGAALATGALLRLWALEEVPFPLWTDDVSLLEAVRGLTGGPSDFADAIRPAPYGVAEPYGTVGVLYLELYRASVALWGSTVLGVRFPSALGGVASLLTAALLGRELLPRGGGTLAALALAGMRWHLVLSRWAWNAIVLVPLVDLSGWLLLRARRKGSTALALLSGALAGVGAHVYLASWAAAGGLLLLALWPGEEERPLRDRAGRAAAFALGFALLAAPLFLLAKGRTYSYFARTGYNLLVQLRRERSPRALLEVPAAALASPWFVPDPIARNDLPGRSRLGLLLGLPLAAGLVRAALAPRERASAFLLCHALAATAAAVAGGGALHPNGYRLAYLTTPLALGASTGVLALLAAVPAVGRRRAALFAVGLLGVSGALGARDALERWPLRRETFDAFSGRDTLFGRAAVRWSAVGPVEIADDLPHDPFLVGGILRHRVASRADRRRIALLGRVRPGARFRVEAAGAGPHPAWRVVERVTDGFGRVHARVVCLRAESAGPVAGSDPSGDSAGSRPEPAKRGPGDP